MDLTLIIVACIILVLGSMLQSAAGFAFGMFAIPLLILIGYEPFEAIAMISLCGGIQTVVGVYSLRKHIEWGEVFGLVLISVITVPVGVWALDYLSARLGDDGVKQVFGVVVSGGVLVAVWGEDWARGYVHRAWGLIAGGLAGFIGGVSGMGGPPVVMWVHAHDWSNQRSRATLWAYFSGLVPLQVFFLYRQFGQGVIDALVVGAMLAPAMILGIIPGLWIGHRIPKARLRQMSFGIIFAISLAAIFEPIVRGMFL